MTKYLACTPNIPAAIIKVKLNKSFFLTSQWQKHFQTVFYLNLNSFLVSEQNWKLCHQGADVTSTFIGLYFRESGAALDTASRCGQIFCWQFGEPGARHSGEIGGMRVCDHSWFQSCPIKSAPLITFKSTVAQLDMAEEAADRIPQPNFMQEETDILVQEVQALNWNLFLTSLMKSNVLVTSLMLCC